jgi:hypothetical protein
MAEQLAVVYTAAGQVEANLIKSMLEAENIPVMVVQEGAGAAYGFTVGLMGVAEILVPEKFANEARELLKAMKSGQAESGDE